MRKILWLALLSALPLGAQVTPGLTTPQIQTIITAASVGSTVTFAAGTYSITAALNLKCGVTYTGPVATPATAILNATYARPSVATFNFVSSSCTQMTTVEYLWFRNGGGIYTNASFSNMTIAHNQFSNIPCCQTFVSPSTVGIYFDDAGGTPATEIATNITITDNVIGDSTSCTTPTNAMTSFASPETIQGNCAGIIFYSSVNGLVIQRNVIGPVGEGVHFQCSGDRCQPTDSPPGPTIKNVDVEFNDFPGIHRIAWEEQPQATQNAVFKNNSLHDATNPYFGNFALSMACCSSGATPPGITVTNNVLIQNTVPHVRWGYGIEAWGNQAIYSNNLIHNGAAFSSANPNPQGISWCYGMGGGTVTNNTVQGPNYASGNASVGNCGGDTGGASGGTNFIGNEGICNGTAHVRCGATIAWSPGTLSGNITGTTINAVTSVSPTISPAPGAVTFPLTVTLTDPGFTSGAQPLGNHSIWYTTDGSTPVPGSGTAQQLSTGGTFSLPAAATVKAVGMWGTGANVAVYPSGYGFVPSGVVSAAFTGGGGTPTAATPVMSPTSQAFTGTLSVSVSDSTSASTIFCTTDGTTPTTGSPVYSGPFSLTATTTIQCIATASGFLQSAVGSGTYTATAPTLTGGFQGNSGSVNTLAVGAAAVQQTAIGTYSDGINRTLPDAFGNTAVWSSANGAVLQVTGSGMVSCLATGTVDSHVVSSPTSKGFSPWTWHCTAAAPASATGVQVIVISENRNKP